MDYGTLYHQRTRTARPVLPACFLKACGRCGRQVNVLGEVLGEAQFEGLRMCQQCCAAAVGIDEE